MRAVWAAVKDYPRGRERLPLSMVIVDERQEPARRWERKVIQASTRVVVADFPLPVATPSPPPFLVVSRLAHHLSLIWLIWPAQPPFFSPFLPLSLRLSSGPATHLPHQPLDYPFFLYFPYFRSICFEYPAGEPSPALRFHRGMTTISFTHALAG